MKRRILVMLLTLIMALSCVAPAAMAATETKTAWVKMSSSDGTLNLRTGPAKTYASGGYVKAGDSIQVYVGQTSVDSENEEWTKIKVDRTDKVGYIKTKYITEDPSEAIKTGTILYISKNGGTMNVRSGAGTNYSIAGYAKHGERITVLQKGSEWSKIKVERTGITGYIKTKYIKDLGGSSSNQTTQTTATAYDLATVMTNTVNGKVNLRKGAGTTYASVTTLSRGTQLKVTGSSGNWYAVETMNGQTGYIAKTYVSFGISAKTTAGVNFRKGAGTSYGVLRTLAKGTTVTLHSVTGNWAKITYGGKTGYVSLNYLAY